VQSLGGVSSGTPKHTENFSKGTFSIDTTPKNILQRHWPEFLQRRNSVSLNKLALLIQIKPSKDGSCCEFAALTNNIPSKVHDNFLKRTTARFFIITTTREMLVTGN
jgi:hypothetical protein